MSILINAYCTLRCPPNLDFKHKAINRRDRSDPELIEHLNGFVTSVLQTNDGEMTQTLYHVTRHILRVQHQFSIEVPEDQLDEYTDWAWEANALTFLPDGSVRDPSGLTLVDPQGDDPDEDAEVPYPEDAIYRRKGNLEELRERGMSFPESLPPVISEHEVELRDTEEVALRMQALFIVAVRAESIGTNDPISVAALRERCPTGFAALTPEERTFLNSEQPDEQTIIGFSWRYEALWMLEWALNLIEDLTMPSEICDVSGVAKIALDNDSDEFLKSCTLRPVGEILDALDEHYCMHWVTRQARLDSKVPPAGLEEGVIRERHHALNWLVRFEDRDWDDVDTPT
jgi:hypothetical protein